MKKFTVHFMTPYCSWEHVEAENQEKAIESIGTSEFFDANEPFMWVASEEESEEDEEKEQTTDKQQKGSKYYVSTGINGE